MRLMRIRLELGRTTGFPEGSARHGYEFVAPLTRNNMIDTARWRRVKDRCYVVRFWGDQSIERGKLRHVGHGWRFDYDRHTAEDDEPFFKLDRHALTVGNYLSVTEHDGIQRPFKIVEVVPEGGEPAA